MSVAEHPENIVLPPTSDGFMFCLWDAVGSDVDLYRRARAGEIPCPLADTCPTRAAHLQVIAQRETSGFWATLNKREKKRMPNKAQAVLFEAEQRLGASVVGPVVKDWLADHPGALLAARAKRLFTHLPTAHAIEVVPGVEQYQLF